MSARDEAAQGQGSVGVTQRGGAVHLISLGPGAHVTEMVFPPDEAHALGIQLVAAAMVARDAIAAELSAVERDL